jgi:DNA primase
VPPAPERSWERLSVDEQVVMDTALDVYQHRLRHEPRALAYLAARGLPESLVRRAGLGYADGHSLEAYLRRRWGLSVAQELGLLRRPARDDDGRPLRELLAGRVVVPELRGGRATWFVGRLLDDDPDRPKYLTLPGPRPVLGFEHAAGEETVYLVEGVFDYLTALAWGLPACSPCGTHLPLERLDFLSSARTVYGVLHPDPAGYDAEARFGARFADRWRPVRLPTGWDLNDLGRERGGRRAFDDLVRAAADGRRGDDDAA